MAVHPPNPKYIPKPYEQMVHPGQGLQTASPPTGISLPCLKNGFRFTVSGISS